MSNFFPSTHTLRKMGALAIVVTGLGFPQWAAAGWISFWGGVATLAATAGAVASGGTLTPVAAWVIGGTQVSALTVDAIRTVTSQAGATRPPQAAGTEPLAFVGGTSAFANSSYLHMALPGTTEDSLVRSANLMLDSLNQLDRDFRTGASISQLSISQNALSAAISTVADEFAIRGVNPTFSQGALNAARATIGASGLPSFEVSLLSDAGISAAVIQDLGIYMGHLDVRLTVASLSLNEILRQSAAVTSVSEPSTLALMSVLIFVVGVNLRNHRSAAAGGS